MTEESTTDDAEQEIVESGRDDDASRLRLVAQKERKARAEAEKELKALRAREDERAEAEKSEIQRYKDQVEKLSAERDAEREQTKRERGERERADMVRKAAKDFDDPEDVVALLRGHGELDGIEDESDAKRVVEKLAKDKPALLRVQQTPANAFEQILQNGSATKPEQDTRSQSYVIPVDELNKMSDAELAALQARDPLLYRRSAEQVLAGPATYHTVA